MKFICANCGELIRESDSPMAFEGWQVHEACGHETFFAKFVVREREKDKQPQALRVRPIGDKSEGVPVADHKRTETSQLPSAADLDAVAREQEAARATADDAADATKAVDEYLNLPSAIVPTGGVNEPRKKGKGAK